MKQLSYLVFIFLTGSALCATSANPAGSAQEANQNKAKVQDSVKAKERPAQSKDLGIGPIKEVKLGPIDKKLAEKGRDLFAEKCMSCHRLNSRLVGPPLEGVTDRMSPEFIMNFMLNSTVMEAKDPVAKALLDEYHVPMIVPGISQNQARAILEYLRSVDAKTQK
ncbi:MAG: cytochrome c [Bacteroidetes bacterium]|nr:cytochrome c [Bacteroidota bacterium]